MSVNSIQRKKDKEKKTYLQNISCIFHTFPITIRERKCRPWDFFLKAAITTDCGDRPIQSVSRLKKKIDRLQYSCQRKSAVPKKKILITTYLSQLV